MILILGGAGRLYGGLIGAIIFMVARDQFSGINPQYWYFWIGMLLIAVVMFLPNGILGGLARIDAGAMEPHVSAPALSTRGLDKSFGSLVVANDIEIDLPRGERYALIGPNGAGKTTLINLMTGMLRPDARPDPARRRGHHRAAAAAAGQARPRAHVPDQHAVPASQRARSGDARGLRAARRSPASGGASCRAYRDAIEEAYAILVSLRLGADCYRPTRELAYGQQRLLEIALALATKPKVLLLDEPAAGVPQDESGELFAVIASLSQDITVLFIEHDMNVVFRFASRIIVMVGGRILVEGTPEEIAADARVREVYLGKRSRQWRAMAEPLLALRDVRAGYGDAVVLDDISFEVPEHGSLAVLGRNGVGKSTLLLTIMGLTHVRRGTILLARAGHHAAAAAPARARRASAGWRRSARFSPRSASRRTSPSRRGPGRWDLEAVYELFPRLNERAAAGATSSPAASSRCWRSRAR